MIVRQLSEAQRKLGITAGSGISELTGDVTAGPGSGSQPATIPADTVTYAKMQNISAASLLLGRGSAAGAGDPEEISLGAGLTMTGTVLDAPGGAGGITELTGDVTAGPGSASQVATIAANAVTDTKLRDSGALSVIGRSANSTGDPADISAVAASGSVLRESGSTVGFGTVATAGIADDAVTFAKMDNINGNTLIGRDGGGLGSPGEIFVTPPIQFTGTGGLTIPDLGIATNFINNDAVTNVKLRNSGALSVIGRSVNSSGDPADISATAASGAVLRESGSVLGFGTIATAGITDAAVTSAKLRNSGALSVIGRSANSSGVPADISATAASGQVLRESGSVLGFGTIVAAGIASDAVTTVKILDDNVTFPKMQNLNSDRLMGRDTAGAGDPEEIGLGAGGLEFTGSGEIQIANSGVTNARLANMATQSIKGNNTGAPAVALDLTVTQVTAMLNVFTDLLKGLVPASGGGTTNFLRADGTFATPPSGITELTGDVSAGPGSGSQIATIGFDTVSNAKLTDVQPNTLKGLNNVAAGNPVDLTMDQVKVMLGMSKQTEVDFGAVMQVNSQTFTIVDASVTATSRINCWLSGAAPTGKDADDVIAEDPLKFIVVPTAGSFDLYIEQPNGALNDKYKIEYTVGAAA